MAGFKTLRSVMDPMGDLAGSRSGRALQAIRRDMDLKGVLFRTRKRNEEVLSLKYQEDSVFGGDDQYANLRQNALNLPYRVARWYEAKATSKDLVIKVNRDAGAGQRPGGPADDEIGMWLGITLERECARAGYKREMKKVINEVLARGTSVVRIGYHQHAVSRAEAYEAGKSAQSIIPEALSGDIKAKPGQAHAQIEAELNELLMSEDLLLQVGSSGIELLKARRDSHAKAALDAEFDKMPTESVRDIRRRVWMKQRRVGEDVGWAPWVTDTEDTPFWWERHVDTVAWVKSQENLFSEKFRMAVEGYDSRVTSGVQRGGKTPSEDDMGSDARQAQSEDILGEDERVVEWFELWYRRPDMLSGGVRKIVCPEMPEEFVELNEENPHVDEEGKALIPGFYPYYDFTPVCSPLKVPEATCGIAPLSVAMPQFEKVAEYGRIRQEAALKGATRIVQVHHGLKDAKKVVDALNNGEIGYAFISPQSMVDANGKMMDAIKTYSFTGTDPEIDKQYEIEIRNFLHMIGMPPSAYQGMGTAETLGQDQLGVASSASETGVFVDYIEERMADVVAGLRGLIRGNYDDDEFTRLLGQEGAAAMKAWQLGTVDDGDEIVVTAGAKAKSQETVEKKQLMEAITLEQGQVEPMSGQPIYDSTHLFEELHRRLDVGAPKKSDGPFKALQQMVMQLAQRIEQLTGENPLEQGGKKQGGGGPNPSEGDGPSSQNLNAGAVRVTLPQQQTNGV